MVTDERSLLVWPSAAVLLTVVERPNGSRWRLENPTGRSRRTSSTGFSLVLAVVSFRRPKRRLLTVVEIPGVFSVISLLSLSGADSEVGTDVVVV